MVSNGIDTMWFPRSALNVKVVSASPCLHWSPELSCAVLSCAVPCRVAPCPCPCVFLSCASLWLFVCPFVCPSLSAVVGMSAFRSLWPSTMVPCFFAPRVWFAHFSRLQALPISHIKKDLKSRNVLETATRSKKTWNHCGGSKASKSRHHGKSVLDCASYWEHEQKEWSRHVHLYVYVNCDLESVFDTDTPHQHTHRTHTTQHNIGKERGTRLFLDSTGDSAGPFSLVCLINSVNERLSLLESPRSYLYLIAHVHVNVYVSENVHVFGQRDIRTPTSRPTQCTSTATQCTPTPTHCTHTHHTLRTHRTPSKSISVRTRKMTFSWWLAAILTCKSFVIFRKRCERLQLVSLRRAGVERLYQVKRMLGGIGNMFFSTYSPTSEQVRSSG